MDINEKIELIRKNTVEIISEDELRELLSKKKKPTVYCGYEPSGGGMHLGNFETLIKLMDFAAAGFKVKVLLADIHGLLNRKGSEAEIAKNVAAWTKTIKAICLDAEIVLGSSFQFKKEYILDVMHLAQEVTITRGLHSMQELARDVANATISQIWYPLMQIEDIKALGCDVATGGIDQRKIHMLARELVHITNHKPIFVHTPMITSLKGPGTKMSKSLPGSGVNVTDTDEEIKKSINGAYCPEKVVEDNPMLQISKLVIFPLNKKIDIKRPEKFGGNISFKNYEELENVYVQGKLHPMDLKTAVAAELIKIIKPIRDNFKK